MRNKGFTLIEIIMVVGIMSVLLSYSLIKFNGYSKLENRMDIDMFANSLINFINNSKEYCRDNNIYGYIYFSTEENNISFNCGAEQIYYLSLPKKFTINIVRPGNSIKIDNRGMTGSACTIAYKDREEEIHNITISVGTAYVDIK
jgi:prepilin-type N-terminal cleavage/methylation domain-containing protein